MIKEILLNINLLSGVTWKSFNIRLERYGIEMIIPKTTSICMESVKGYSLKDVGIL